LVSVNTLNFCAIFLGTNNCPNSGLNTSLLFNSIPTSVSPFAPTKGTKSSSGLRVCASAKLFASTPIPLPLKLLPIWSATNTSDTGSVIAPIVEAALTAGL
jgi:hypothetical protein